MDTCRGSKVMHISDGVLSPPVLIAGAGIAAIGTAIGLKKMDSKKAPEVAVLSSAFFVASLIHIPVGPTSTHLVLNGMMGLMIGWVSFPAMLVSLFLQAILFQFGGLTTLGVNTVNMAVPAVVVFYLFRKMVKSNKPSLYFTGGFLSGVLAILLSILLVSLSLLTTEKGFLPVARVFILTHVPVMLIEGIVTAFVVGFIKRVSPEILEGI